MMKKPVACHSEMWKEIVSIMEKQIEKEKRVTGLIKPCERKGNWTILKTSN